MPAPAECPLAPSGALLAVTFTSSASPEAEIDFSFLLSGAVGDVDFASTETVAQTAHPTPSIRTLRYRITAPLPISG